MSTKPKYYIVESSALPEVFLKVAEAKRLLSTGEASTVNEATRMTDISRSAFYKYRDAVLPFQSMMTGRIITFEAALNETVQFGTLQVTPRVCYTRPPTDPPRRRLTARREDP